MFDDLLCRSMPGPHADKRLRFMGLPFVSAAGGGSMEAAALHNKCGPRYSPAAASNESIIRHAWWSALSDHCSASSASFAVEAVVC